MQAPHPIAGTLHTRSPTANRVTPSPRASTTPVNSCPRTIPPRLIFSSAWRSLPQIPARVTRISISRGPGRGAGASPTVKECSSVVSTAFIQFLHSNGPASPSLSRQCRDPPVGDLPAPGVPPPERRTGRRDDCVGRQSVSLLQVLHGAEGGVLVTDPDCLHDRSHAGSGQRLADRREQG